MPSDIHTYIYMCVCVYIYTHTHINMHIQTNMHTRTHMHTHMYTHTRMYHAVGMRGAGQDLLVAARKDARCLHATATFWGNPCESSTSVAASTSASNQGAQRESGVCV